jgi:hypothetical protein
VRPPRDEWAGRCVLDAPLRDDDLGFEEGIDLLDVEQLVRTRPFKFSMNGFFRGEPGSM